MAERHQTFFWSNRAVKPMGAIGAFFAMSLDTLVAGVAIAGVLGVVVVIASVAGWLGTRVYHAHQSEAQRNLFVEAARQTALNLTTFNYAHADADIKRILDSSAIPFCRERAIDAAPAQSLTQKRLDTRSTGATAGTRSVGTPAVN